MCAPLITVEGLGKCFAGDGGLTLGDTSPPVRAVDGVSFEIGRGETLALVGESGCGKSTLGRLLLRLIEPSEGRVFFEDVELTALKREKMRAMRARLQMIFQDPFGSLSPRRTIFEIVAEPLDSFALLPGRAARRLRAYPHQFSGGMRQRVMIAMAVACNPRLLIADEPTTALDVTIQAQVLELMKSIRARLGTAILLISHDLGIIAEVCERVIVMYAGKVLEEGDVRSIFSAPAHPYTRGLLHSIPRLDDERRRLYQIAGQVPGPGKVKQGCPFYARCPSRIDRCAAEMPPMFGFGAGHRAACWVTAAEAAAPVAGGNAA
jgi:peptide/nickel transport system ATP-binding protein